MRRENRSLRGTQIKEAVTECVVLQSIQITSAGNGSQAHVWFGSEFGGCSFVYGGVRAFVRNARVELRGGKWEYRDAVSHEVLDFFAPFDESFVRG
jgi:hypothetical protein